MLNKMKLILNILSAGLIIFTITTNVVFAEAIKETAKPTGFHSQMIIMAVLFGAMYFLFIRPQTNRAKEHNALLANLANGDEVITAGGLLGKVNKIIEQFVVLGIADGVEVAIQKHAISQVLPKGTIKSL